MQSKQYRLNPLGDLSFSFHLVSVPLLSAFYLISYNNFLSNIDPRDNPEKLLTTLFETESLLTSLA